MPEPTSTASETSQSKRRSLRRWLVLLAAVVFFGIIFQDVLFPFSGRDYVEVSHGDHSHYVPEDRDPDVPIGNFPTRPPEANERIAPDGEILPR